MTYLQAEMMFAEFEGAVLYKEHDPDGYKEAAHKYTKDEWAACERLLMKHIDDERSKLHRLFSLIDRVKGGG